MKEGREIGSLCNIIRRIFFLFASTCTCVCVLCVCVCVCAYRSGAEARASRFAFRDIYMLFLFNQSRFTISGIFFRAME